MSIPADGQKIIDLEKQHRYKEIFYGYSSYETGHTLLCDKYEKYTEVVMALGRAITAIEQGEKDLSRPQGVKPKPEPRPHPEPKPITREHYPFWSRVGSNRFFNFIARILTFPPLQIAAVLATGLFLYRQSLITISCCALILAAIYAIAFQTRNQNTWHFQVATIILIWGGFTASVIYVLTIFSSLWLWVDVVAGICVGLGLSFPGFMLLNAFNGVIKRSNLFAGIGIFCVMFMITFGITFTALNGIYLWIVEPQPQNSLNINIEPVGAGKVSPSSGFYNHNRWLSISAEPASGYIFDRWEGDIFSNHARIPMKLDSDISTVAHFKIKPSAPLSSTSMSQESSTTLLSPVKYFDDFSDITSGWSSFSNDNISLGYQNGAYEVHAISERYMAWGTNPDMGEFTDFDIEVDATLLDGNSESNYGIVFRWSQPDGPRTSPFYYALWINGDRSYQVTKNYRSEGENIPLRTPLLPWTQTNNLTGINDRLKISCHGTIISVYINGNMEQTVSDSALTRGSIYLAAINGNTRVSFDNFEIYGITCSLLTSTTPITTITTAVPATSDTTTATITTTQSITASTMSTTTQHVTTTSTTTTTQTSTPVIPTVTKISDITADQNQTIIIDGSGFGNQDSYNGNSRYIKFEDVTAKWAAGYTGTGEYDAVTLNITQWTDNQIVISGLTGSYGGSGGTWVLHSGDEILLRVWNIPSGNGPALFTKIVVPGNNTSTTTTSTTTSTTTATTTQTVTTKTLASGTIEDSFSRTGEIHYYTFKANAGDNVFAVLSDTSNTLYVSFSLESPGGNTFGPFAGANVAEMNAHLAESGTYKLIVQDASTAPRTGTYTLTFNLSSENKARKISDGALVDSSLSTSGQANYYVFSAKAWTKFYFNLTVTDVSLRVIFKIYKPDGTEILPGEIIREAGNYTVMVRDENIPPQTGSYQFRFHLEDAS